MRVKGYEKTSSILVLWRKKIYGHQLLLENQMGDEYVVLFAKCSGKVE